MSLIRIIILCILMLAPASGFGQKTMRKNLKLKHPIEHRAEADTIVPKVGTLKFFGYEKAQNSSWETMFVTNETDQEINQMKLTIDYYNANGEKLHSRTEIIKCAISQGETKTVSLKSWDKQHVWHYHNTQARHNDHSTPFDIKIHPVWIK